MKITLTMPPALNSMYRANPNGRGVYKTKEAKDWTEENLWSLVEVRQKISMINEPVKLRIDFYFKRDRDIDSSLKALLDLFRGKLYKNDSQINELTIRKFSDKERPRVEVFIEL